MSHRRRPDVSGVRGAPPVESVLPRASKMKHSFSSYLHFDDYVPVQAKDGGLAVIVVVCRTSRRAGLILSGPHRFYLET